MLAYPHGSPIAHPQHFTYQVYQKPISLSGLQSTPTAGPRETQIHTCGEAHSLCLVAQESNIHVSQHQI